MNKKAKILLIAAAGLLASSLLAACTTDGNDQNSSSLSFKTDSTDADHLQEIANKTKDFTNNQPTTAEQNETENKPALEHAPSSSAKPSQELQQQIDQLKKTLEKEIAEGTAKANGSGLDEMNLSKIFTQSK